MKRSTLFLLVALSLLSVMILPACGAKAEHVNKPTHFVCYQQGVAIVDTITVDGAEKKQVINGDYSVRSWVWDDASGHNTLSDSDTISCLQSPVDR
jgi:hydroxyacyl-ACP dehydratase HTD2-like protein with hotdog domain